MSEYFQTTEVPCIGGIPDHSKQLLQPIKQPTKQPTN